MRRLALQIKNNLSVLAKAYDDRLRLVSGYDRMPDEDRLEAARNVLLLIASGLESGDASLFTRFVETIASERLAQGFEIDSVQQALTILVDILEPGFPDVETANFLWRTMVQVHMALSKMATTRLRTAEQQFRYLADNLAVGIFIHRNGILRYAGREGTRMLGYEDPEGLIGRSVFDFVHPDDRERVAAIARARVAGKVVPDQYEARLLRRDGSVLDVQLYSTLTEYEGQLATQGVFVDISERKREEERIRQSHESLQTLIDSMPFGVMIAGRDKRIRHANQSALASMGYQSEDEVVGRICHETMCPAAADSCPILDMKQRLDRSERELVTRDGDFIPILKSAVPVTLDGEELLLEAFVDITDQKRLERQIQESLERRGRQVETSTEVAQEISATPVLSELYQKVVTLVKGRFGYYHAQLFLLNEAEDRLVTVAGYGEVGRQLQQQGHFIPMGKGVVGRTAARGKPVLSSDVSQDPEWLYHPLLPETKGELAVPIILRRGQDLRETGRSATDPFGETQLEQGSRPRGRVLGVLDVQSTTAGALTDDDRILLEGLCGQIAIAMESTRLREETEEYLHELEHLTRIMSREGWESYWDRAGAVEYLFNQNMVLPAGDAWVPESGESAGDEPLARPSSDARPAAVAPLKVRGGELIGVLGVEDDADDPLSEEEWMLVESVSEQVAQALESARLLDEQQRSRALLGMRVEELDCLNDIGRKIDEVPTIPEFLHWLAERIPSAMQYPDLCRVAIEFEATQYGDPSALHLACQMEQRMRAGREAEGRICVAYEEERAFLEEEMALLGDIARRVAGYIENRRLFQQTEQRLQELTMLFDVSRELASAPIEPAEIGAIVAKQFVQAMGVPEASVSLLGPGQNTMQTVADVYADPAEAEARRSGDDSFGLADYPATATVMETLQSLVVHASDPDADPAELAYMQEHGTDTLVIVPMVVKGQAIGVVELEVFGGERHFTPEELNLSLTLANQAAVSLENARLLVESQVRADEQAILSEIAQALAACQSVDSVLEETYQGVSRLMGVTDYYVALYDAEADETALIMAVVDGQVEWPRTPLPAGELGLVQRLIARREPLLLLDRVRERAAELGASVLPLRPGQDALSWLGAPMLVRDQVLGAMVAESYTAPQAYDQHSQVLLTAVANQTAIALENVRLLEDTQEALAEVQSTHRTYLQQAWHEHLRQREMLNRSGFLYDQAEAERQEDAAASPELWRPEIERAVAEGSPVVVQDGDTEHERAGLAVPITLRGQTLGVIGVESPTGDRKWTEDDIAFVEAISEQLGQALESARLFADTQRRAERERLVSDITSRIRASTDMRAILEATAEELGRVLGTSRALVRVTAGEPPAAQQDKSPPSAGPPADGQVPAEEEQRESHDGKDR